MKSFFYPILKNLLWLKKGTKGYAILTYHNIVRDNTPRLPDQMTINYFNFRDQIHFLFNEFSILSVTDIIERIKLKNHPEKLYIGITFDDGYLSHSKLVAPLLKDYNIPATFFITTDFANQAKIPQLEKWKYWIINSQQRVVFKYKNCSTTFDLNNNTDKAKLYSELLSLLKSGVYENNNLNDYLEDLFGKIIIPKIYMNWSEIKEINKYPIFTIGAHSKTHSNMTKVKDVLNSEIIKSKSIIEKNIKSAVKLFAYPYGLKNTLNSNIYEMMKYSGFDGALTSIMGHNNPPYSYFCLNRIAPLGFEKFEEIKTKIYWADEITKIKSKLNLE